MFYSNVSRKHWAMFFRDCSTINFCSCFRIFYFFYLALYSNDFHLLKKCRNLFRLNQNQYETREKFSIELSWLLRVAFKPLLRSPLFEFSFSHEEVFDIRLGFSVFLKMCSRRKFTWESQTVKRFFKGF